MGPIRLRQRMPLEASPVEKSKDLARFADGEADS
jgi:hypothetical protein